MSNNKNKYYIIKSKGMATTISYLLGGKKYYTMNGKNGEKIYSFEYDDEFQTMLDLVKSLRYQHNEYYK